jgi:hypothetical protein
MESMVMLSRQSIFRAAFRAFLIAVGSAVVAGCAQTTEPQPDEAIGYYPLRSVDGGPLPYLLGEVGAERLTLYRGSLLLSGDGRVSQDLELNLLSRYDAYGGDVFHVTMAGTWARAGGDLRLTLADGTEVTGTVGGGSIAVTGLVRKEFGGYEIESVQRKVSLGFSK